MPRFGLSSQGPVFLHADGGCLEPSPHTPLSACQHFGLPGFRDLWQLGAIEFFPQAARGSVGTICRFAFC